MKGGKEAKHSNKALMGLVTEALGRHGCSDAISLVSGRDEVADLLKVSYPFFSTSFAHKSPMTL
jgi:gamma-glutamyl phosphate reductase